MNLILLFLIMRILLVFSRSEAFYDAILYSTKVNGEWTDP